MIDKYVVARSGEVTQGVLGNCWWRETSVGLGVGSAAARKAETSAS